MIGGVTWPSLVGLAADPGMPATIALSLAGIGVLCLAAVRIAGSRPVAGKVAESGACTSTAGTGPS
jgi:hypothetical protein